MDEFDLINRYFKKPADNSEVTLGVGDDCAVLRVPEDHELVFSVDSLVADIHFLSDSDASLIGERALRVALSDLAAMGAKPLCFTLALSLPEANENWLAGFSKGLFNAAQHYDCDLVGGDTVKGPLQITIQVNGIVPQGQALRRDGAGEGDHIFVSGTVGDGAAALRFLQGKHELNAHCSDYFHQRFHKPEPRLALGQLIRTQASAAIDISDGLLADLGHICKASGLGAEIELKALPQSDCFKSMSNEEQRLAWALSGGDDYQLCFTVPQKRADVFQALAKLQNLDVTNIGKMLEESGLRCSETGQSLEDQERGYKHFS